MNSGADRERYKAYKGAGYLLRLDPSSDRHHAAMAEIQFIVDKLNEPPFNKDLRLVRTGLRGGCVFVLGSLGGVPLFVTKDQTSLLGINRRLFLEVWRSCTRMYIT